MTATRQQILSTARSYLDVKFHHLGRSRERGLDCFGLVIRVAWDLRLSQFVFDAYDHIPNPGEVMRHCGQQMIRIGTPTFGDVALMAFDSWPCHLAILADKTLPFSLIHAYAGARKVVETPLTGDLRKGVRAYYRLPNVQEVA